MAKEYHMSIERESREIDEGNLELHIESILSDKDENALEGLLEAVYDKQEMGLAYRSCLYTAVRHNQEDDFDFLLNSAPPETEFDLDLLTSAIEAEAPSILRKLLSHGDFSEIIEGHTNVWHALGFAINHYSLDFSNFGTPHAPDLEKKKACLRALMEAEGSERESALILERESDHPSDEMVSTLVGLGADVNFRGGDNIEDAES